MLKININDTKYYIFSIPDVCEIIWNITNNNEYPKYGKKLIKINRHFLVLFSDFYDNIIEKKYGNIIEVKTKDGHIVNYDNNLCKLVYDWKIKYLQEYS
jgi:hypothetical protein